MRKSWFALATASVLTLAGAAPGAAQVFTPTFMTPYPANEFGIYVNDGPGDLGLEAIFRRGRSGGDFGLRAGYADIGDGALTLGIEVRNPVVLAGAPIGLAFTAGAQALLGGDVAGLGGQVGFSIGQEFPAANFTVTPYIHPRLALLNDVGTEDDDEFEVDVLADLGVDIRFQNGVSFRVAGNLGQGVDWGLGVSFRQ